MTLTQFCAAISLVSIVLIGADVQSEPFAPLPDLSRADPKKNALSRLKNHPDIPEAADVPVPALPGASLVGVSRLSRATQTQFQWVRQLKLATDRSVDEATDFYRRELKGWASKSRGERGNELSKEGEDIGSSRKQLMIGASVKIRPIETEFALVKSIKAVAPTAQTLIEIQYPLETLPALTANAAAIDAAFNACVDQTVASFQKLNPQLSEEYLRQSSGLQCQKIKKSCAQRPQMATCQRHLHTYK